VRTLNAGRARRAGEQRKFTTTALTFFGILCLGLLWAVTSDFSKYLPFRAPTSAQGSDSDARTAKITWELPGSRCRQMEFNNDTGEMLDTGKPCGTAAVPLDSKGVPAPAGTARRLEAISKAFSK
jgi:hypothetical protein